MFRKSKLKMHVICAQNCTFDLFTYYHIHLIVLDLDTFINYYKISIKNNDHLIIIIMNN